MTLDLRLVANGGLVTTETDSVAASDTTGVITATANEVAFAALARNVNYWRSIDYGASYFTTNFSVVGKINISALSATGGRFTSAFSNTDINFYNTGAEYGAGFSFYGGDATTIKGAVLEKNGTTPTTGPQASFAGALSTDFYYFFAKLSSIGGQYGGLILQVFSDAGRTTLVSSGFDFKALVANQSYQFFQPVTSYPNGTTPSITGTNSDLTFGTVTAGIDLTTGVETDTGTGRLVVYADCIVATALNIANSETAKHVAIDEGADFFGDYTVSGVLNITAFTNGAVGQMFDILAVTDAASDAGVANDLQGISIYWATSTTFKPYIHQAISGSDSFSTVGPTLNTNQPYSFTLSRSGTTLTMKVWNDLVLTDFAGTSQVGSTITWTGRAATTYRYLMPVASCLNGATSRSSTFTLGGVKRTGGVNTASYTSDGGFVIGGSATNSRSAYATGSGGILLGGSATHSRSTAYIATGGFIIGGAADFSANGAASVSYTSSGGFVIGGTAANSRSSSHTGSGGFRLGGSAAYSFTLQTNVQEIVFELYDSTGAPITGATTLTCKLRTTPGAQIYDWSDETFKSSGWTTISADLNEIDATNLPGVYKKEIDVSNFADGRYQVFISYSATQSQHGSIEFLVDDGQMVDEYTATNTHTALIDIAATPAAILAAATATPIAANMEQTNAFDLKGDGTAANKFRSTLAP